MAFGRAGTPRARVAATAALVLCVVCALVACGGPSASAEGGSVAPAEVATVTEGSASDRSAAPASRLAAAFATGEVASVRLIGDSITAGVGCEGFGATTDTIIYQGDEGVFFESAPSVSCWANDFRSWALAAGASSFVNAGIPGARMSWLADEPEAWLGDGADVIVVMLGTNDAVWSDAAGYEDSARRALAAADAACELLVVVSPPMNARTDGRAQMGMETVDCILASICAERGYEHASLLDAVAPGNGTLNDDWIHPTSVGSHAMWESLRSLLGIG